MDPSGCDLDYPGAGDGPLIDRVDMIVHVHGEGTAGGHAGPAGERSAAVAGRIRLARARSRARDDGVAAAGAGTDAGGTDTAPEARAFGVDAVDRLGLSERDIDRALQVARTIADLGGSSRVRRADVAEALAYRRRQCRSPAPSQAAVGVDRPMGKAEAGVVSGQVARTRW